MIDIDLLSACLLRFPAMFGWGWEHPRSKLRGSDGRTTQPGMR